MILWDTFRNFPELYIIPVWETICLVWLSPSFYIKFFNYSFFLNKGLSPGFPCPFCAIHSLETPSGIWQPCHLIWDLVPAVCTAEDWLFRGQLMMQAPLHCSCKTGGGWTLPCTPEARMGAKNQEKKQPKQSTSVCCTLKNTGTCQSRKAHNKGLSWAGLFIVSFLTPATFSLISLAKYRYVAHFRIQQKLKEEKFLEVIKIWIPFPQRRPPF